MAFVSLPTSWRYAAGNGAFDRTTASTVSLVGGKSIVTCLTNPDPTQVACESINTISMNRAASIGRKAFCVPRSVMSVSISVTYDNTYITPANYVGSLGALVTLLRDNTDTVEGAVIRGLDTMGAGVTGGVLPSPILISTP